MLDDTPAGPGPFAIRSHRLDNVTIYAITFQGAFVGYVSGWKKQGWGSKADAQARCAELNATYAKRQEQRHASALD